MKKIIFICFLFLMAQNFVFADEILESNGNIINCKVETVMGGLIEYKKDGNIYYFERSKDQPIFNDYADAEVKLFKKETLTRYTGKIMYKDAYGVRLINNETEVDIPWYRLRAVGVYKP